MRTLLCDDLLIRILDWQLVDNSSFNVWSYGCDKFVKL